MPRRRAFLPALLVASSALLALPAAAAVSSVGSPTAGDPYFPRQGNGGYDVHHYGLDIAYTPATHHLVGTTYISALAVQSLTRFDLDLRTSMVVSSVVINGARARFSQPAAEVQELVITPARTLPAGRLFSVKITYAGTGQPTIDPDGSFDGFIPTNDGVFVASEPQGSPTWFPVNDTPDDKASYDVRITVPAGLTGISDGQLIASYTRNGLSTFQWQISQPISSYLVTATIGKFDVTTGRSAAGIPYYLAVDPTLASAKKVLALTPKIVDYYQSIYGPYPFSSAGGIVDDAPGVGYSLEVATKPVYAYIPDEATVAHELAHQWFGDSVTLSRWRDIWLNEGFAEFTSWLWGEHTGGPTTAEDLKQLLSYPANTSIWNPPPANPGTAEDIFDGSVYERGAGTLAALRIKVGDPVFFKILRGWAAAHRYGNATVEQFTAYASAVAQQNLTPFFKIWLYDQGKPTTH